MIQNPSLFWAHWHSYNQSVVWLRRTLTFSFICLFREVINRLCMMIRGVGDPLVGIYARMYLARKAREVAPELTDHLTTSFNDYLHTHTIVSQRPTFQKFLTDHKISLTDYVHLYSPAIEWLLQCIAHKATVVRFAGIGPTKLAIPNHRSLKFLVLTLIVFYASRRSSKAP